MSRSQKTREGYCIIGPNTSTGQLDCWYMPTLETANAFAKQQCESTGHEVIVAKYVGSWEVFVPAAFIPAVDYPQGSTQETPNAPD